MTQFKEKADQLGNHAGILTYPILMAADILIHKANEVPVGDDQTQHLELTRNIVERFNNTYGEIFPLPERKTGKVGARLMSLRHPENKMSKSNDDLNGTIYFDDSKDEIIKKFKSSVTDSDDVIKFDADSKKGISNLIDIYSSLNDLSHDEVENKFENLKYGEFKIEVGESVVSYLEPIREKYNSMSNGDIASLIKNNLEEVKDSAKNTSKKIISKGSELKQRMAKAYDKNIAKKVSGVSGKFSGAVKKIKDVAKKALPVGIAGAVGFGLGKGTSGNKKGADEAQKKIEKDAAIDKQVDDYVKKRQIPGGPKKIDPKQFDSRGQKTEPKPETKTETKPKKMHSIEKKNRARLGDAKVDALKAKNKDFQAMKKGGMSKDDFIKKYPKSITAQKAAGLRDHTEWDAYDMVLEYLFSTEQVSTLEEANYVMMEMDQTTIGDIVKEVKVALNEDV